jgi:hypothetical protein
VQWQYKDFKPKDPIEIHYYMTQLPIRPEEVGPFLEQALRGVAKRDRAVELEKIRQLLLATYGEEPQDSTVRAFAAEQLWYAPSKDFSAEKLTPSQRAIVRKVDERISELKAKN